nr:retrovirus-related Pol polyprotein from transposon TNT 1-94 [Tanacetum cinerariifolium]
MVDNTFLTKKKISNLIIVQIYVDKIIFGLICQDACDDFSKIMHDEFEMRMMGGLNFFLGLQIKQMEDGIFFNQSKYIKETPNKFGLEDSKPMKTHMSLDTKLTKDEECESVDSTKYRGMIGECSFTDKWSLDDLKFSVPMGGPYQTNPPCPDEIKNYVQEEREGPVTLFVTKQPRLSLPYGMLLTRLFKYVMSESPELSNYRYVMCDRVIYPFTAQQERKTRKDYDMREGRSSTSSSSAFCQPSSSHPNDDDDNDGNDKGTSRASTPSPTRIFNSLSNDISQIFSNPPDIDPNMEAFYTHQPKIFNRQVQLRDEQRGGIRSIENGIKNLMRG